MVQSRAEGVAQQLGRWASSVSEAVGSREQQQVEDVCCGWMEWGCGWKQCGRVGV